MSRNCCSRSCFCFKRSMSRQRLGDDRCRGDESVDDEFPVSMVSGVREIDVFVFALFFFVVSVIVSVVSGGGSSEDRSFPDLSEYISTIDDESRLMEVDTARSFPFLRSSSLSSSALSSDVTLVVGAVLASDRPCDRGWSAVVGEARAGESLSASSRSSSFCRTDAARDDSEGPQLRYRMIPRCTSLKKREKGDLEAVEEEGREDSGDGDELRLGLVAPDRCFRIAGGLRTLSSAMVEHMLLLVVVGGGMRWLSS
mmetsp:Transcript_20605/g.48579  ORF Transcript_20605/g.48579 Transcript_20605/m.48579 type:complete len:255 (+) Transcript_20605:874-1638(+)